MDFLFCFFGWWFPVLKCLLRRMTLLFIAIIYKALQWAINPSLLRDIWDSSMIVPIAPMVIPIISPPLSHSQLAITDLSPVIYISSLCLLSSVSGILHQSHMDKLAQLPDCFSVSSTIVILGFISSVPFHHVLSSWTLVCGLFCFNSLSILFTNLFCHCWISFLFISHFDIIFNIHSTSMTSFLVHF